MATKTEVAKQYVEFQQARDFDGLISLLADDVELKMPMAGEVSGKDAVGDRLRNQPGGDSAPQLEWSDPEEEGEDVKVAATGAPFGPLNLVLSFNDNAEITKINIAIGRNGGGFEPPPLDMRWAKAPTERPPKPSYLGEDGFTLAKADAGSYGWAPEHWPYENDTPRGAWPARDANRGLPAPYTIFDKHEVWADNAADLYELAIRERWVPATEVSWGSIEPLDDHVEAALDQVYTYISETQYNSNQMLMGWLQEISYGYHEVKLYLSTQVFDQARHLEAFRKRALTNGGGLGVQQPGFMHRTVYASFKFTELVTYINILRGSFLLALVENEHLVRSEADRQLFSNTANDLQRHLAYGVDHLKHYLRHNTTNRNQVNTWLGRGEAMMAADIGRDGPMREALILALGENVAEGKARLKELRQAQLQKYLKTLEAASVYKHEENLIPAFQRVIDEP